MTMLTVARIRNETFGLHTPRDSHDAYRPDIDGLRAISILLVIGFHAAPALVPGGYVGVDIFFVISGYLITGILIREIDAGTFSLARFYGRRIRRILTPRCSP